MNSKPESKVKQEQGLQNAGSSSAGAATAPRPRYGQPVLDNEMLAETEIDVRNLGGKMGQQMWLMKVPKFLVDHWGAIGQNAGVELGRVTVETVQKPGATRTVNGKLVQDPPTEEERVRIVTHQAWEENAGKVPAQYECTIKGPAPSHEYAFTEDLTTGAARKVAGYIQRQYVVKPSMDKQYLDLVRKRKRAADHPQHEVKVVEIEEAKRLDVIGMQIGRRDDGFTKAEKKQPRSVAARMDDVNALHGLIISYFRTHEYTSAEAIATALDQPKVFIREQLPQVAVQEKTGTYANMWRLKPEYKQIIDLEKQEAMKMEAGGGGGGPSGGGEDGDEDLGSVDLDELDDGDDDLDDEDLDEDMEDAEMPM